VAGQVLPSWHYLSLWLMLYHCACFVCRLASYPAAHLQRLQLQTVQWNWCLP
jgi:hypothetical protein